MTPVVSIDTLYTGAAASVVETRITQPIEDRIAGIEGINFINSTSTDGRSRISIEFTTARNIDDAANDIRDRVSGLLDNLPEEADPPTIEKTDSNDDVIIWISLTSDDMSVIEITDYAQRYLVDRFSILPGVARVRIGGGLDYAMRIWLDRNKMAARGLTVSDVENALRSENIELPAGSIESIERQFTARAQRAYQTVDDFRGLWSVVVKTTITWCASAILPGSRKALSRIARFFAPTAGPVWGWESSSSPPQIPLRSPRGPPPKPKGLLRHCPRA